MGRLGWEDFRQYMWQRAGERRREFFKKGRFEWDISKGFFLH